MRTKSLLMRQAAEALGVPVVDIKMAVERQFEGHPIQPDKDDVTEEYELRIIKTGLTVAAYPTIDMAQTALEERTRKHADRIAPAGIYRVTKIVEKI